MSKEKINDLIKEFEERSVGAESGTREVWDGKEEDNVYDVDIHIWRHPGMGNSLQTISGNKLSIMTATASYLETLLRKDIMTESELIWMCSSVLDMYHGKIKE
jgi:hypothetical protein